VADLITWSPRKDTTGDDRYYLGADPVYNAGTEEWTSLPLELPAGASDYSSTPTIAEISARTGMNQLIAEIKRQETVLSGGGTVPSYKNASDKILATDYNNLKTCIINLRSILNYSVFTWTLSTAVANSTEIKNIHFMELRKAVPPVYGRFQIGSHASYGSRYIYTWGGASWGSPTHYWNVYGGMIGYYISLGSTLERWRQCQYMEIPSDIPDCVSAKLYLPVNSKYDTIGAGYNLQLWGSDDTSDVPADGDQNDLDDLLDELAYSSISTTSKWTNEFDIDSSYINARKGLKFNYCLATDLEIAGPSHGPWNESEYVTILGSSLLILTF